MWPTHADGTNKKVGEMTAAERKAVMAAANVRFFAAGWPELPAYDVERAKSY